MKAWKRHSSFVLPFLLICCVKAYGLEANGAAVYTEFGNNVYIGTLYLDSPGTSADNILTSSQAKRMELRLATAMSPRRWSRNWTQSIAINAPRDVMVAAANELSAAFGAFKGDLKPGDSAIIDYNPVDGTSLSVNGVILVTGKSPELFNLFLSSWIGPVPPSTDFKNAILGMEDWDEAYAAFQSMAPEEGRVAAIEAWESEVKKAEEEAIAQAEAEAQAEEEARKKEEEAARREAEQEELEEQQRQAMLEEEKRKAEEAARQAAVQTGNQGTADDGADVVDAQASASADTAQDGSEGAGDEGDAFSVEDILAQQDYTTSIVSHIYKSVKYPATAVRRNQEGSVRAMITIDKGGNLVGVQIVEKAPYDVLNGAVEDAIRDAAPFPAIPEAIKESSIELMIPVSFRLN